MARPQILIVDDDARYLELVQFALESEGFSAITSSDPKAVTMLALSHRPSVVVLDVSMPGMDGFAVAAELRADSRTTQIPVLFLTARNSESDRLAGMKAGAMEYMTKPFSPAVLAGRLREVVKEKS